MTFAKLNPLTLFHRPDRSSSRLSPRYPLPFFLFPPFPPHYYVFFPISPPFPYSPPPSSSSSGFNLQVSKACFPLLSLLSHSYSYPHPTTTFHLPPTIPDISPIHSFPGAAVPEPPPRCGGLPPSHGKATIQTLSASNLSTSFGVVPQLLYPYPLFFLRSLSVSFVVPLLVSHPYYSNFPSPSPFAISPHLPSPPTKRIGEKASSIDRIIQVVPVGDL